MRKARCALMSAAPEHCQPEMKASKSEFSFLREFPSVPACAVGEVNNRAGSRAASSVLLVLPVQKSGSRAVVGWSESGYDTLIGLYEESSALRHHEGNTSVTCPTRTTSIFLHIL